MPVEQLWDKNGELKVYTNKWEDATVEETPDEGGQDEDPIK